MKYYYILCIFLFSEYCFGQQFPLDSLAKEAIIHYDHKDNTVHYRATTPKLNQIAGAPKAFYTYFWEFGDGSYSFKEKPTVTYPKQETYTAKLWATNNYANGKAPSSRPKSVTIQKLDKAAIDDEEPSLFDEESHIILQSNRQPLPEEEFVWITSYKNPYNYVTSGRLYLFYNEKKFKNNNFEILDTRTHNGEQEVMSDGVVNIVPQNDEHTLWASTDTQVLTTNMAVQDSSKRKNLPLTLEESKALCRDVQIIEFDQMQPGEERNIFRTLQTTPEMIKDTSAIVTLRSVYVPDNTYDDHTIKDTEMEIVSSHDPNKMSSNGWLMNYRIMQLKRLKFKIRFQNTGEGPARAIRLEAGHGKMFKKSTLKIEDMYPPCPICPKDSEVNYSCLDTIVKSNKIIFQFKRVYLPGTEQKNGTERDSTKGFVKYSMKFNSDAPKKKTRTRTSIFFDSNDPIHTNYITTRFTHGISYGPKAGYIFSPEYDNYSEYFVGLVVSPYKSYRWYYQTELMVSRASYDETITNNSGTNTGSTIIVNNSGRTIQNQYKTITGYLVPASLHYNFSKFIAAETGVQVKVDITNTNTQKTTIFSSTNIESFVDINTNTIDNISTEEIDNGFTNFQAGGFIGAHAGMVRLGISGGIRYVYNFYAPDDPTSQNTNSQIQVYGVWKF